MFSNSTKVMFFDVGQGDSALITTFMGYKILIDTGEYTDSGIIAAHCGQRINAILITHPDLDHYGGIFNILDNFTVDVVYLPHTLHEDNIKFISTLKEQYEDINIQLLKSGDYIQHKNLRIDILHPIAGRDTNNINDESIVMKVKLSNYSILFTGDMNLSKLSSFIDISSDVIKMPHHGDSKVINKQSLSKVGASLGVISVGADNRYGHPNKQTLQLMNMFKMKTLRTDLEGQISIYILLNSYYLFTYR